MFLAAAHSYLFYVYFALYLMFVSASQQVFNTDVGPMAHTKCIIILIILIITLHVFI